MASVGHIAVGMAAARVYRPGRVPQWSSMASWSALSLLPDADVIGFALGVQYGDEWGHRGATHSLTFSIALGLAIGLAARWFKRPAVRTALVASAVLTSHALLDTMTDGGLGCALLWPFDLTRFFAAWRPIPVAPIGLYFFSRYGAAVALTELVLFSPLLVFGLRSRNVAMKRDAAGAALWLVSVWFISSADPIREAIMGFLLREDTVYSKGFSEAAFRTITPGQPDKDVRRLLGVPFGEDWFYFAPGTAMDTGMSGDLHGCRVVRFETGAVVTALDLGACNTLGIERGMSLADVDRRLGPPPEACWQYSWSPSHSHYRARVVCVSKARVAIMIRQWE
jgi:inner membrane protein